MSHDPQWAGTPTERGDIGDDGATGGDDGAIGGDDGAIGGDDGAIGGDDGAIGETGGTIGGSCSDESDGSQEGRA